MIISIILPVYNVQDYISSCLDSLCKQMCDEVKLECILVDDCSTDGTLEVITHKLEQYEGETDFVVVRQSSNGGVCRARNEGIKRAKGEYVFFVDSDDELMPDAIKVLYDAYKLYKGNKDVDVVIANTYMCKSGDVAMKFDDNQIFLIDNTKEEGLQKLLTRKLYHTPWNKLIRKDFFLKYHLFFEDGIIDEDLLWSYTVFLHAKNIVVVPKVTYIYKDNPYSIMNTTTKRINQVVRSRIIISNRILDNPCLYVKSDYFSYLLFILTRAVDIFNHNIAATKDLEKDLVDTRNRLFHEMFKNRCYVLLFFSLCLIKPFSYIYAIHWYRRYYDAISKFVTSLDRSLLRFLN